MAINGQAEEPDRNEELSLSELPTVGRSSSLQLRGSNDLQCAHVSKHRMQGQQGTERGTASEEKEEESEIHVLLINQLIS